MKFTVKVYDANGIKRSEYDPFEYTRKDTKGVDCFDLKIPPEQMNTHFLMAKVSKLLKGSCDEHNKEFPGEKVTFSEDSVEYFVRVGLSHDIIRMKGLEFSKIERCSREGNVDIMVRSIPKMIDFQ